jgi:hypothetical protein
MFILPRVQPVYSASCDDGVGLVGAGAWGAARALQHFRFCSLRSRNCQVAFSTGKATARDLEKVIGEAKMR